MRGYPKGFLTKQDYINLLAIPEFADQAKADLAELAFLDDSMITVDRGTEDAPKIEMIENPLSAWKRAGFKDRAELEKMVESVVKIHHMERELKYGEG